MIHRRTLEWVPYDEIPSKPSWEGDRIFLNWILGRKPFFSAKFNYEAGEYVSHNVEFYGERKSKGETMVTTYEAGSMMSLSSGLGMPEVKRHEKRRGQRFQRLSRYG